MNEEEKDVKTWAVCYVTQESPLQKWTVVTAETARDAAEMVTECNSLCNVCGVFKHVDVWRWR